MTIDTFAALERAAQAAYAAHVAAEAHVGSDQRSWCQLTPAEQRMWVSVARAVVAHCAAAQPAPSRKIDGKFSTDGKHIFNAVSGERIPDEEPLFLLRGRDAYALAAIDAYQKATEGQTNELHQAGIQQVREKFCRFAAEYAERMKEPGVTRHLKLEPAAQPFWEQDQK